MHSPIRCMCIDEGVILPDQFVVAVVLVGHGDAAPGDGGYISTVVVSVFIGVVAAVLYMDSRGMGTVGVSTVKRTVP